MSERQDRSNAGDSTEVLAWIDAVADQFEASWKQGAAPRIADFLGQETGTRRLALLEELVKIDLAYRWQSGDGPKVESYLAEFPELLGPSGTLPDHLVLQAPARRLRCPQCGNWIEALPPGQREATCPSCGGSFRVELEPEAGPAARPRTLGRFQLLQLLGRGSFGAVYKARDAALDRVVAIKIPRAGYFTTAEEEERFLREARSAAQLRHPHIVAVHEIGHEGDMPYLVCDYIEGPALADLLTERRPGFRESAELVALVADALDFAHRHKIVHRDVNPRNILIDAAGGPHVTDFGLARRDEGTMIITLEGEVLGTPAYMAPEQAAGEQDRVDGRSDVYSLGVVLYELLTGERPFRGHVRMLLYQVIHDEPRPPRKLNDRIPRDLETICLKAMAKSPARRYATASELATDLRRLLNGEPIRARPVTWGERLWRWCRRNPVIAGLSLAVFLLLVAVAVSGVRRAVVERAARTAAERSLQREQELVSFEQASRGVLHLEGRDSLGLLHLLEARKKVEAIPEAWESRALLWSGWYASCGRQLAHVLGHDDAVSQVDFSPDGRFLATVARDDTARLWDAATGRPHPRLFPLESAHREDRTASFSPDGKLLATISTQAQLVRLWVTTTGEPYRMPFSLPAHGPAALFSPDGKGLVTKMKPGIAQLWDLATGQPLGKPLQHDSDIYVLALSPDGKLLATASNTRNGLVKLWEMATGRGWDLVPGHMEGVHALAFSPDSKLLATASWDKTARLWDTATGKPRSAPLLHDENVHAVAFSPDGKRLATGSFDGTARLWDTTTWQLHNRLRHEGPVIALAFSPDGKRLATGSFDGTARLWETATGELHGWPFRHQGVVSWVAFSPDGRQLATASADRTVRLWDLAAGEPRVLPHNDRVWGVAFSRDGKLLATGSEDGLARLWDTTSWRVLAGPLKHSGEKVLSVALSPDGKWLATAGHGLVQFWETATGRPREKLILTDQERFATFSPDSKLLATGGQGTNPTRLWSVATGLSHGPPMKDEGVVEALAFSPDSRLLTTGSSKGLVQLWDTTTGQPYRLPLRHGGPVEAVAFSPDGQLLATASRDMTVRLWDPGTGEPHGRPLWQKALAQALAFSPDGRLLATASADGAVRFWDLVTGLCCGQTLGHEGWATSAAFSPDGKWLATGSFDKTVRLWPVPVLVTDPEEMELRTWVALGARFNDQGIVETIPWQEWQDLRRKLRVLEAGRQPAGD